MGTYWHCSPSWSLLFCWGIFKRGILTLKQNDEFYLTAIICLLYGIMMEFVQRYFIANRSFDTGDIIADGVGSAAGVIYSSGRYIKK